MQNPQMNFLAKDGSRKFYDLGDGDAEKAEGNAEKPTSGIVEPNSDRFDTDVTDAKDLCRYVNDNVIGKDKVFSGPFGLRNVTYCDYTASGRALKCIEDYIKEEVLPEYGNTHTTTTVTSLQTTLFRHEARDIVRNAVNASEHDAVIFVGSGCTAAVHKVIHGLNLKEPPVVFVSPYEHHSNLLPWREVGATVVRIPETENGSFDINYLDCQLKAWKGAGRRLMGCFTAASNITGTLVDVDAITICLHRHGALALWDYATAGPYVNINMNPVVESVDQPFVYKDAVFISTHKFVGGVQTPGILVAKKSLFSNPVPSGCGGGSVFFVRRESHRYLQEAEMREEGGTPAIVESIRAGMVFQIKEAIGSQKIMERELSLTRRVREAWDGVPNLSVLGNMSLPHLPIYSFLVRHPQTGLYLHHNFVCALLNDLFGIQARGGCACAGPYAEDLLGISEDLAKEIESVLAEDSRLDRVHLRRYHEYSDKEILRPGFTRLNLPYFMDDEAVNFVLEAVKLVAQEGWKLLPQYKFNPETGEWRHMNHQVFKDRKWLGHISYSTGAMTYEQPKLNVKGPLPQSYDGCIETAKGHLAKAHKVQAHIADQTVMFDDSVKHLRWFLLPSEALRSLRQPARSYTTASPFHPVSYPRARVPASTIDLSRDSQATGASTSGHAQHRQDFQAGITELIDTGFCDKGGGSSTTEPVTGADVVLRNVPPPKSQIPTPSFPATPDHKKNAIVVSSHISQSTTTNVTTVAQTLATTVVPLTAASSGHSGGSDGKERCDTGGLTPPTPSCLDGVCLRKRKQDDEGSPPTSEKTCKLTQKWHPPPKAIFKPCLEAMQEHNMIEDGDKVMVCLSGGKDSLTLLHTLRQYQFYARNKGVEFRLGAVTVDPQTASYDPSPLKSYLKQLGVPYFYEEQAIMEQAQSLPYECASICSFCSRMKRGRIYAAARREGYTVLALGQHLDDLAESFLMSIFHNGILRTMKAHYTVQEGDLRVIRPLVYVREKDTRQFAETKKLPVIAENCPACFEAPKERHRIKQMLAGQEVVHPRLFHSLLSAMRPIIGINRTGVSVQGLLSQVTQGVSRDEEGDIDLI